MTHKQQSPNSPEVIRISDVSKHLTRLARVYNDKNVGNAEFGEALNQLAKALKPYAKLSIVEFADSLQTPTTPKRSKHMFTLPENLESLPPKEIERVLNDENCDKKQLVELGFRRFSISRGMLAQYSKVAIRQLIHDALNHERSLDVISREAKRSGESRLA